MHKLLLTLAALFLLLPASAHDSNYGGFLSVHHGGCAGNTGKTFYVLKANGDFGQGNSGYTDGIFLHYAQGIVVDTYQGVINGNNKNWITALNPSTLPRLFVAVLTHQNTHASNTKTVPASGDCQCGSGPHDDERSAIDGHTKHDWFSVDGFRAGDEVETDKSGKARRVSAKARD